MLPRAQNKGLVMQVIPKVVEGWNAKYVTGSGQTSSTRDRVFLYESEGNVRPFQRGKLVKKRSLSVTDESICSDSSVDYHTLEKRSKITSSFRRTHGGGGISETNGGYSDSDDDLSISCRSQVGHSVVSVGMLWNSPIYDFLAKLPTFSNLSDQQLSKLEKNTVIKSFRPGDIVFTQADEGDLFFVIQKGEVDMLVQERERDASVRQGGLGRVVKRLAVGCFFGEQALMTDKPRAATIRCVTDTECLVFTRAVFEDVISGSNEFIGSEPALPYSLIYESSGREQSYSHEFKVNPGMGKILVNSDSLVQSKVVSLGLTVDGYFPSACNMLDMVLSGMEHGTNFSWSMSPTGFESSDYGWDSDGLNF